MGNRRTSACTWPKSEGQISTRRRRTTLVGKTRRNETISLWPVDLMPVNQPRRDYNKTVHRNFKASELILAHCATGQKSGWRIEP